MLLQMGDERIMINLEMQKKQFEKHVAKFTDLGQIKILDFGKPNTNVYAIRFLFDETSYALHITGDLGELTATNYNNMTYEGFKAFVRSPSYFKSKINCCSRGIIEYNEDKAYKEIEEYIKEYELELPEYYENTHDFICDVLENFSDRNGLSEKGYDVLSEIDSDCWEWCGDLGKESTGIIETYLLAFELATEQLKNKGAE